MITGFSKLTLSAGNGKLVEVIPNAPADRFNVVGQVQGRAIVGFTDGSVFVPVTAVLYAQIIPASSNSGRLPCCAANADDDSKHDARCPRLR
jgi:hypothetical protein